jgi:cytochrome c biogenesis protein CcmG/thiol:disulfide interchange protein DsbE
VLPGLSSSDTLPDLSSALAADGGWRRLARLDSSLRPAGADGAGHARFGRVGFKNTGMPRVLRVFRVAGRSRAILLAAIAVAGLVLIGVLTVAATGSSQAGPRPLLPAKSFTLPELGHPGRQVSLTAFAGQPVIVNFFQSTCVPCRRETPLLAGFYAQHHGQVHIIGVDANDPEASGLKFVRKYRVGYPVGVDPFPANTAISYGVQAIPQTFFLNARHQIVRRIFGVVTARELDAWTTAVARTGTPR